MRVIAWRNLLLGAGAYFLSRLVAAPIGVVIRALTSGVDHRGDVSGALLWPVVQYLPDAVAATGAGVAVALLVDSDEPVKWTFVPAFFYVLNAYATVGIQQARVRDYVGVAIGALLPAITCVAAGRLISWHRRLR